MSLTRTLFDGVRFYAVSPSIVSIAVTAVGLFTLFTAIVTPKRFTSASRTFRSPVLVAIAFVLWIGLGTAIVLPKIFPSDDGLLVLAFEGGP